MKRVLIFALAAVSLDASIGWTVGWLYHRTFSGGRAGLVNYALAKDADLLILGSSRAQYQIMPAVLSGELSMRAFNAGLQGHDFLYSVLLYDLWKRLHQPPRMLLLHVDIESLLRRPSELEGVQILSPYIDDSELVREVLYLASPYKRIEYWSRAYRYNGKVFVIARNLFVRPDFNADGYIPATGTLDPHAGPIFNNALDRDATSLEQASRPFWERKVHYLRDLAEDASRGNIRLFLFHTPLYGQDTTAHNLWKTHLRQVMESLPRTEFIDLCEVVPPEIFLKPDLFSDANHLNEHGAVIVSESLARELKTRLAGEERATHDPVSAHELTPEPSSHSDGYH